MRNLDGSPTDIDRHRSISFSVAYEWRYSRDVLHTLESERSNRTKCSKKNDMSIYDPWGFARSDRSLYQRESNRIHNASERIWKWTHLLSLFPIMSSLLCDRDHCRSLLWFFCFTKNSNARAYVCGRNDFRSLPSSKKFIYSSRRKVNGVLMVRVHYGNVRFNKLHLWYEIFPSAVSQSSVGRNKTFCVIWKSARGV